MHSPNLTDGNIARIRELFPGCVTEIKDEGGKMKDGNTLRYAIDFDLLRQELSGHIVEGPQERYHLNWPGKSEALLTANAPIAKTLRPCREESVDFDTTKNLFIEGDNLDALKLLQETYLGKVKMIYIDPPYNTGNDFIYEDDFAENADEFLLRSNQKDEEGNRLIANTESNGRFHSDWLSMIYPRLKLARNLLRDDGVIFISIDENEVSNLRNVCNEIFGNDNYLTELIIKVRHENRILKGDKDFHETCEYCIAYRKSDDYKQVKRIEDNKSIDKYIYAINILGSPDEFIELNGKVVEVYSPEKFELIKHDTPDENFFQSISIRGTLKEGNSSGRFYMKHLDKINGKYGYLYKVPAIGNDKYDFRYFMRSPTENHANGIYFQGIPLDKKDTKEVPYPNFYDFVNDFNNVGYEGGIEFRSGKKPIAFLKMLYTLGGVYDNKESIVLDFFCGSASSAEACLKANATDGGSRKFIMVQLPEDLDISIQTASGTTKSIIEKTISILDEIGKPHILTEIGKERIRRSGSSILSATIHSSWNKDIGFRVLKIDSSNMAEVYYTPDAVKQEELFTAVNNIKPGRTPEDLLFQVLLDLSVDLSLPIRKELIQGKSVFFVNQPPYDIIACFDTGVSEELVKELAQHKPLRVVFCDTGFTTDTVKINADQIFNQLSPGTEVKSI